MHPSSLPVPEENLLESVEWGFYGPDVIPATQLSGSTESSTKN